MYSQWVDMKSCISQCKRYFNTQETRSASGRIGLCSIKTVACCVDGMENISDFKRGGGNRECL